MDTKLYAGSVPRYPGYPGSRYLGSLVPGYRVPGGSRVPGYPGYAGSVCISDCELEMVGKEQQCALQMFKPGACHTCHALPSNTLFKTLFLCFCSSPYCKFPY